MSTKNNGGTALVVIGVAVILVAIGAYICQGAQRNHCELTQRGCPVFETPHKTG